MNKYILSSQQCREIDHNVSRIGISLSDLMDRVAYSLYDHVTKYNPYFTVILCGPGNNGGDGYALCKILNDRAYNAVCIDCSESIDSKTDLNITKRSDLDSSLIFNYIADSSLDIINKADVVVDCIFGTGFKGLLSESLQHFLNCIINKTIIACDIPSGIECDTDYVSPGTLSATETISFQYYKQCFFLKKSNLYCGKIKVVDIGIPEEFINSVNPVAVITQKEDIQSLLKKRLQFSHKGDFGLVDCICGSEDMTGAAILAAKSALASGVGMVNVSIPQSSSLPIRTALPEALINAKRNANSQVIGPGLGNRKIDLERFLSRKIPTVIDADAINYLACKNDNLSDYDFSNSILTPHTVEFSRISHLSVDYIESNRISVASSFSSKYKCILILKGHYTVISLPDGRVYINAVGNSGLSKGGSGDVLAGYIGGLLAQGYDLVAAALIGVYCHGLSAEVLSKNSFEESDILPSKIIEIIGKRELLLETN